MSTAKPNDFHLKCIIIIHLSKTKVSSTAQQLHSHSRSSGWPAKGQSWALHPGSQGVEEVIFSEMRLPRTPRVGFSVSETPLKPKPNGLGNPNMTPDVDRRYMKRKNIDIIWYLLIYVRFRGYQVVLHQVKKTLNYCKTCIFSACVYI